MHDNEWIQLQFVWRCHDRDFLLDDEEVKLLYLALLVEHKKRFGIGGCLVLYSAIA